MEDISLRRKKYLENGTERNGRSYVQRFLKWTSVSSDNSTDALTYSVKAFETYRVFSPNIKIYNYGSELTLQPDAIEMECLFGAINTYSRTVEIEGTGSAEFIGGVSKLTLGPTAKLASTGSVTIQGVGQASMNANIIQIG
jgi:hypothetical protein